MFLSSKNMKPIDPVKVFEAYDVSDKDLERYSKMDIEDAIDDFIKNYVIPAIGTYQDKSMIYFDTGTSGEVDRKNEVIISSSIIGLSLGFKNVIKSSISKVFKLFSKQIFKDNGIQNVDAKNAILNATLDGFNELIEGAMSQTQAAILQPIRDAQRMFIQANQAIVKNGIKGKDLDLFNKQFKKNIAKQIPQIEEFADKGLLLARNGRKFGFHEYFDMSIRTTALNIERHAVEYMAEINQDEIVGYKLIDNRKLKTHGRGICKSVLSKRIDGVSYLALTENAAKKLGIKMLSTAKQEGAMGVHCRHGIFTVPKNTQKELLSA